MELQAEIYQPFLQNLQGAARLRLDAEAHPKVVGIGNDDDIAGRHFRAPRILPRPMAAITLWATQFPERKPEHYLSLAQRYRAAGNKFYAKAYKSNSSNRLATSKKRGKHPGCVRRQFPGGGESDKTGPVEDSAPLACRFHDLSHTAVSRMLNAGVPIAKAGNSRWSNSTMVIMAERYGHFTRDDLRGAVESISGVA